MFLSTLSVIGVICLAVILVVVIGYIVMYNKIRRLQVKVEEGASGIDVALEKRYDLLSEEIEAVKKYLKHEYETYTAVTSIRTRTELEDATFQEQKALSQEALKTIDKTIQKQSEQLQKIKKQMRQKKQNRQDKTEQYETGMQEQKMNVNHKIGLLSSIQQNLGGVGSAIDALSEQYPVLYSSISMEHFQRSIFDTEEHLQAARRLYNANVSLYNQTIVQFPYCIVAGLHHSQKADFYEVEEQKKQYRVNFDDREV